MLNSNSNNMRRKDEIITTNEKKELISAINRLMRQIDNGIVLSPGERRNKWSLGEKRINFMKKLLESVEKVKYKYPDLINSDVIISKLSAWEQYGKILIEIEKLCEVTNDHYLTYGSDAFDEAREIYHKLKALRQLDEDIRLEMSELMKFFRNTKNTKD